MILSLVDVDGRTTIPLEVRRRLQVEGGDRLVWDLYPDMGSALVSKARIHG